MVTAAEALAKVIQDTRERIAELNAKLTRYEQIRQHALATEVWWEGEQRVKAAENRSAYWRPPFNSFTSLLGTQQVNPSSTKQPYGG